MQSSYLAICIYIYIILYLFNIYIYIYTFFIYTSTYIMEYTVDMFTSETVSWGERFGQNEPVLVIHLKWFNGQKCAAIMY